MSDKEHYQLGVSKEGIFIDLLLYRPRHPEDVVKLACCDCGLVHRLETTIRPYYEGGECVITRFVWDKEETEITRGRTEYAFKERV